MAKKICLNMIVKNESHIICETFDNILKYVPIDYWVISDTGSTDNTKELITTYFKEKNIDGELVEHEWQDFGYNRTKALEAAYNKSDYLFIFDADDKITGNFKLPFVLNENMYHLQFGETFTYLRPLLINNRKHWEYKGVLHEFLSSKENVNTATIINGEYYIESGRFGNRSKNPTKYFDDAIILENAFEKERIAGDLGMACRYAFYCAQSYKDCQMIDKSIEWYKKCIELPNWVQEKYYSSFIIGSLLLQKNDVEEAFKYFCKTVEYDNERIEGVVAAMEILLKKGDHLLVNGLYHRFKNYNKIPSKDKLFVFQDLYKDKIEYFNSISASYVNDKESGYLCCKKILLDNILPDTELLQTVKNLLIYGDQMRNDNNILLLFESVDKIIFKNNALDEACSIVWKDLYNKRKTLVKFVKQTNFVKIINSTETIDNDFKLEKISKNKYEIVKGVDDSLTPNFHIKQLFRNNNFSYNKRVVCRALNHVNLWKKLMSDRDNDFYIILEGLATASKIFSMKIEENHNEFLNSDLVFLGYTRENVDRENFESQQNINTIKSFETPNTLFISGVISYSINKMGAKKLLESVEKNGIQESIDIFIVNAPNIDKYEYMRPLIYSDFKNETNEEECFVFPENKVEYVFLQGIDQMGNDIHYSENKDIQILLDNATNTSGCVAFNTFGYLKNKIEKLEKVPWFSEKDGIFIQKDMYEQFLLGQSIENIDKL